MTSADVLDALTEVSQSLDRLIAALRAERTEAERESVTAAVSAVAAVSPAPEWMSVAEAAKYTPRGYGQTVIRAPLADRSLTGRQTAPGCPWAIRKVDLDQWLTSRSVDGGAWDR